MSDRDTHFKRAAELAAQRLREQDLLDIGNHIKPLVDPPIDVEYEKVKLILAQFAYDLVRHALEQASHGEHAFDAEIVFHQQVTDLDAWPDPPTTVE